MSDGREYHRIYMQRRRALDRLGLQIMNPDGDNQPVMDSRRVAVLIEKRHAHLIRDIRRYAEVIDANPKLGSLNSEQKPDLVSGDFFILSSYEDSQGKSRPCYMLTKQGCEMVANKMTGDKGILFTAMYVSRFNEMEEILKNELPSKRRDKKLAESQNNELKLHLEAVKATAEMLGADDETLLDMIESVHEHHGIPTNHLDILR